MLIPHWNLTLERENSLPRLSLSFPFFPPFLSSSLLPYLHHVDSLISLWLPFSCLLTWTPSTLANEKFWKFYSLSSRNDRWGQLLISKAKKQSTREAEGYSVRYSPHGVNVFLSDLLTPPLIAPSSSPDPTCLLLSSLTDFHGCSLCE